MRDRATAKSGRPFKRDVIVIDDDDSTNQQPAVKSVKIEEEPVPSLEVVELKQKVAQLEDQFQHACRMAGEARLRAERAENLLDPLPSLEVVELKQKVAELEDKFQRVSRFFRDAELRAERAENLLDSKMGVKDCKDEKIVELKKKMANLIPSTSERRERRQRRKRENEEKDERLQSLSNSLSEQYRKTRADLSRIDELKRRIALYEKGPLQAVDRSMDIFQLYCPDSNEGVPFVDARNKLIALVELYEGEKGKDKLNACTKRLIDSPEMDALNIFCHCCYTTLTKHNFILHLLSKNHNDKMANLGAGVSRVALGFWKEKLTSMAAAVAAPPALRQAAGAAVAVRPMLQSDAHHAGAAQPILRQTAGAARPMLHSDATPVAARPMLQQAAVAALPDAAREAQRPAQFRPVRNLPPDEQAAAKASNLKDLVQNTLAKPDLSEKLLHLVKKAFDNGQLRRGIDEVKVSYADTELIIMAADGKARQMFHVLHTLASKNYDTPYVLVRKTADLDKACGITSHHTLVSIIRKDGSPIESLIREIKNDVQHHVPAAAVEEPTVATAGPAQKSTAAAAIATRPLQPSDLIDSPSIRDLPEQPNSSLHSRVPPKSPQVDVSLLEEGEIIDSD